MFCSSRCCTCSRRREPAPTKLTADTRAPRSSMPLHSVWKCACRLCVRGRFRRDSACPEPVSAVTFVVSESSVPVTFAFSGAF